MAAVWKQTSARCSAGRRGRPSGRTLLLASLGMAVIAAALDEPSLGAAALEPVRVRAATALIDDTVRRLLPIDVVVPAVLGGGAPTATVALLLTELRYCGAGDRGSGRFRAVVRTSSSSGAAGGTAGNAPLLSGEDACRQPLEDLNKLLSGRLGDHEVAPALAEVEATWRPWELRLVVTRVAGLDGARPPGGARPPAGLEGRRELLRVSTAGLRLVTEGGETINVHVAPSFAADGIELAAVLGENGAGAPVGARLPGGGPSLLLGGGANVMADLPHGPINQLLRQLTSSRPLAIPVDREVIDLHNPVVTGAPSGLSVSALATPRWIRETARLTVQAGGDEVKVLAIRADAQLENCAELGTLASIACTTRNAGRNAAAATVGAALSQKYQGQLVRELAGTQTLRFDVGARRFAFSGDLLHLGATGRGLSVAARFALGGMGH